MYLNINILLIILLYQCLTTHTFQHNWKKFQSDVSSIPGLGDCVLPIPGKNDLRKPIPIDSIFESNIGNMSITVKHDHYITLKCASGKFKSIDEENLSEIKVQCLHGQSVRYKQYAYEYDYFECDDTQRLLAARRAFRTVFIPKTRQTPKIGKNDCVLKLRKAPLKMPVIFTYNKTISTIIHPDKRGNIVVRQNDTFKMACVGNRFTYPSRFASEIFATCLNKTSIQYKRKIYQFETFRCKDIPKATIKETEDTCQIDDNKVYDVGFQTKKEFLTIYKICYDPFSRNTLYSWYTVITPIYGKRQRSKKAPEFIFPTLQDNYNLTAVYANQTEAVYDVVQSRTLAMMIIKLHMKKDIIRFLKPGLLITPSEFIYLFEQRSSYIYENTAPVWFETKQGIWHDVETLFRRCMSRNIYKHVIVTGTYGTCLLPNKTDVLRPLFLDLPSNVPVPEYIWRLDYNMDRQAGIVFIVLNNPYKPIDKNAYICKDIPCPGGLKRKNNYSMKGFLYCCSKAEFERVYGRIDPIVYWDYTEKKRPARLSGIF